MILDLGFLNLRQLAEHLGFHLASESLADAPGAFAFLGQEQALDTGGAAITDGTGLGRLAYDPANATGGLALTQTALNTQATINGVAVSSQNNTLSAIDGVTLNVSKLTTDTGPVEVSIKRDTAAAKTSINNFVSSFNAISNALAEMTKYDAATKTGGTLQGDSTALGLQAALRRMVGGSGPAGTSVGSTSSRSFPYSSA